MVPLLAPALPRSIRRCFEVKLSDGAPERIRTSDPQIRRLTQSAEIAALSCKPGAIRAQSGQWVSARVANQIEGCGRAGSTEARGGSDTPREAITIDFDGRHAFEAAADFLAVLAYPDCKKQRENFRLAFITSELRALLRENRANRELRVPAGVLDAQPSYLRQGLTRLNQRRQAGEMLISILWPEHNPAWMNCRHPTSNTQAARLAVEHFGAGATEANVFSRVVKSSRPVMHAAASYALLHHWLHHHGLPREFGQFAHDGEQVVHLIGEANLIRPRMREYAGPGRLPPDNELIEIRLAGEVLSFFQAAAESDPAPAACSPSLGPATSAQD